MVSELLKYGKKPEGPLQTLQAGLELGIQIVVHTLHAYKVQYLKLPQGLIVSMSDLGYETRLCNMALVSASASWEGFRGNIVRAIRVGGHSFNESRLSKYLEKTSNYERILEPLARRHCIVHNLAKVDKDYMVDVPSSTLNVGDSLYANLSYLKDASVGFFETAVDVVKLLIGDGLLGEEHQKTIGEFQYDPRLENEWKIPEAINMDEKKKQFLGAMKVTENTFDRLPSDAWFLSRGFPPDKVRFAFRCVEAPITYGDWTAITISSNNFFKLAAMIPKLAEDMTKK